ncbi:hypothetical protein [Rhodobacter xanthinilyticus]|nr:hypothetical protein [Rhodobacter xanthinilyticus]
MQNQQQMGSQPAQQPAAPVKQQSQSDTAKPAQQGVHFSDWASI